MMRGDGDNKAWSPGRARISRNTIAQGMPAAPAEPVVLPRAFLLHADHGCSPHPAFPAPSVSDEGDLIEKLGRHAPREQSLRGPSFSRRCEASSGDARKRAPQDEVLTSGTMP